MISVVIPVKNGDLWIEDCIKGIMSQTLFNQSEIIVIDSGSTDNTLEILRKFPVQVHTIPSQEFNHGSTRNFGVSLCKGEFVVMTVQDAVPADKYWLENLLKEFTDNMVAGVCGVQVVAHDPQKNPRDWSRPVSKPVVKRFRYPSPAEFDELSPKEKKTACAWDNVNAMYRREILTAIPFAFTVFGEDMIWAKQALRAGYTLVYTPEAKVYHYHVEDAEYTFKRTLTTFYYRYKQFDLVPAATSETLRQQLSAVKSILFSKGVSLAKKIYWWNQYRHSRKAAHKAYKVFVEALGQDEEELDRIHELYCGKPPVPVKSN